MKKLCALLVALFLILGGQPTFAAEENSAATSTLRAIVPDVYAETSGETEIKISQNMSNDAISVTDQGAGVENSQVSITLLGNGASTRQNDGLTVVGPSDSNFQQVIQPLQVGFRILNISRNKAAPKNYSYELDLPPGSYAEIVMGTVRISRGDEILGSIKEPWALDADGNQVETHFSLNGLTLTQHLEPEEDAVYPLISDPNWGYVATYKLGVSYTVAWQRLHTCFNCYFPVSGAPSKWPSYGQLLPLYVDDLDGHHNMECVMNYATVYPTYNRWKFFATKKHMDGLGSYIIFELRKTSTGVHQLVVDAFIVNDAWGGTMNWYVEMKAKENWAKFAENLSNF